MSKLSIKDINRIAEEVEKQEIEFWKRKHESLQERWYREAVMDSDHEDWGCRD